MAGIINISLVLIALIIVSAVAILVRRIKLPYTLALVFTGLGLTLFSFPEVQGVAEKFPELLLTLFLPALLFEGAMNINTDELLKNIKTVSLLSVAGVILSVLISGLSLHYLLGLSFTFSFLFGALISPTDPIAVINVFKQYGISKKLSTIIESEALFNDGTGIVIFKIILGFVASGLFNPQFAILEFVKLTFGGLLLGLIIGYAISLLMKHIDDRMVQISLTTIAAYGGYILAESLGTSGVITVAVAGITVGIYASKYTTPSSKLAISSFWEYSGFILNSVVFLLIGLEINVTSLLSNIWIILAAFLIVAVARIIQVSLLSLVINKVDDSRILNGVNEYIPPKWVPAIAWGGLHGGLSMVLALTISPIIGIDKPLILSLTFGVVFFSLLIQGLSMAPLLKSLKLMDPLKDTHDYQLVVARLVSLAGADKEIEKLYESKIVSRKVYNELKKEVVSKREEKEKLIEDMLAKNKELEDSQLSEAKKAILIAKKSAVLKGMKEGLFAEEIGEELIARIDKKLMR